MTATENRPDQAEQPAPTAPTGTWAPIRQPPAQRDDTTRYLCAAAHLDARFADGAIREFLVEPLRAISPSPAIDSATVLREAGAARRRGLLRDRLLLAILILLLFKGTGVALLWTVFGVGLAVVAAARRRVRHRRLLAVLGGLLIAVGALAAAQLLVLLFVGAAFGLGALVTALPGVSSFTIGPYTVLLPLATLIVLVLDRYAVALLMTRSFRRGMFVPAPDTDTWPGERWVRGIGHRRYHRQLARVEAAGAHNLTAYRGYEPFVGAGVRGEPLVQPIQLTPRRSDDEDDEPPRPFTLAELYDYVTAQLMTLRDSSSLAPSARLAGLTVQGQVIVPVAELLVNFADPATRIVLPSLDAPPGQTVPDGVVADVTERPLEWMRYYRCFRMETWNRDVTVSAYLHFGASDRVLYFEWIPFVLHPIAARYRVVDQQPVEPLGPLRDALLEWTRLPGTLLWRSGRLFRRLKPIATRRGFVVPAQYGSSYSLRELGASGMPDNYFQDSDVTRYVQLLTGRMWRAIGEFLEDHGIEVTDFMRQAEAVGDQYTFNGPVHADSIGSRNRVASRAQQQPKQ